MTESAANMREQCLAFFQGGITAADPQAAVRFHLQSESKRLESSDKIHIIAFGKAACAMAQAARSVLPATQLAEPGIVVTTYDNARAIAGFEVFGAGHPLPDANGVAAAHRVADKIRQATSGELILVLISGGGSALLPYPVDGISLTDKIATTQLLLGCGADIEQINCVRKHLSRIKGGGLARMAAPTALHALMLSDVLGDDFSAIASGPTVADHTTFANAIAVLKNQGIWEQTPAAVKDYLQQGAADLKPETPKAGDPVFGSVSATLIGGNSLSVDAVVAAAERQAYQTHVYSRHLTGEAREVGEKLAEFAKHLCEQGITTKTALIAGGETTVTLKGNGKGGRNQEMALAFALAAEKLALPASWSFLSGGTDGRDGPTDAAGGLVDGQTLNKIRAIGIDPNAALDNNDSHTALQAADGLVVTGATGTNVADLQILLLHPSSESKIP